MFKGREKGTGMDCAKWDGEKGREEERNDKRGREKERKRREGEEKGRGRKRKRREAKVSEEEGKK